MAKINPWERLVVSYDLETTGLSPFPVGKAGEIIEIGAVLGNPKTREVIREFEVKVFPEHIETASPESLEFNNYNLENWVKEAATSLDAALVLFGIFAKKGILLAQNHTFDWLFMSEATGRFGIDLERDFGVDYHRLDVMSMSYNFLSPLWEQESLSSISLAKVAEFLGISPWEEHTALADAYAAWGVFCELQTRQRKLYEV